MSPFSAARLLSGLVRTAALEDGDTMANAARVATWLEENRPCPGQLRRAASSPFHEMAKAVHDEGAGSGCSLGVQGGRDAGRVFIEIARGEPAPTWPTAEIPARWSIHRRRPTHQHLSDEELVGLRRCRPILIRSTSASGSRRHPA